LGLGYTEFWLGLGLEG